MQIFIGIILFLLGFFSATTIFCYNGRRIALEDQRYWRDRAKDAENNLNESNRVAQYYNDKSKYWHGVAVGDKAHVIYDSAIKSFESGDRIAVGVQKKR